MADLVEAIAALPDKTLLVLDDDAPLRNRLGRALETRGFEVRQAESVKEAIAAVRENPPAYAVLDLRLEDGTGLSVVETIREARPDARVVMLTGYGNIATAVAAVKAGAIDYLAKPGFESGWQTFPLTAQFATYSLRYKTPPRGDELGYDYIGIRPVAPDKRRTMEVRSVRIHAVGPKE